jgi:hypothetical protein
MKQIRTSKFSKFLAYYLAIMMFLQVVQPMQMYALTSGPTQPEFNAFTPIGTSDMVDLASGDFNYNIPVMDVGGYPINLAYNSGVTMDQEASWVGLGWNLNVGQIERQVRGLPDDFKGDEIRYENDLRDNVTIGTNFGLNAAFAGYDAINLGVGLGVQWNNYEGITFKPSYGIGFELSDNVSVGLNFSSSVGEGATVSPSVSISGKMEQKSNGIISEGLKGGGTLGLGFNSRKGVENLSLSLTAQPYKNYSFKLFGSNVNFDINGKQGGLGGSITFNNTTFTPSKRIGFENGNFSFSAAAGAEFTLVELQGQITGYGSYQKIASAYKNRKEKAYGYENTHHKRQQSITGDGGGVLDFNRENERTVSENTTVLPVTNYTYDTYNISGQGVSGMFRPFKSQVSYVYNDRVVDNGMGGTTGIEFGGGNAVHWGGSFTVNPSSSSTGGWNTNNNVLPYFNESNTDLNNLDYENTTFKLVGGLVIDPNINLYKDKLMHSKAINIKLGGSSKNRKTEPYYMYKNGLTVNSNPINSKIKRTERFVRNQVIQKITAREANGDPFVFRNENAKDHHTSGIKVLQTDGSTYIYGSTAYNVNKVEASFDVSSRNGNNTTGLVTYNGSLSGNHSNFSDKYVNRITTPQYAHSYLITSVLSSDYEDIDGNGLSLNDLGSYTQFDYKKIPNIYKWRVPFEQNTANFSNGLFSNPNDEKANYLYGEKELVYLDKIVTKTHVAFFDLEERLDAVGVQGQTGGAGIGRLQRLKSIRLYSRNEVTIAGSIVDPGINGLVKPIKMAHFEYDYSLCKGTPNSIASSIIPGEVGKGKLTLKKVYFTYRGSNMGKYTPYVFEYNEFNPNYDNKAFDIWGNYKENLPNSGNSPQSSSPLSTAEYPFVEQDKLKADLYSGAWALKVVNLPSGGKITIETESDEYQYVQDQKAMQMFKVVGAGNSNIPQLNSSSYASLYNGNIHNKYLYVKLNENVGSPQDFIDKYLSDNIDKYIYFRFLLNMTDNSNQKDYVNGYFQIDQNQSYPIGINDNLVAIPIKFLKRDGGTGGSSPVNPIAKTGWGFGRTYLNREVYSLGGDSVNASFGSVVRDLLGSIEAISQLIKGPNKALQDKGCARIFDINKSWIRLENPNGKKLGGGLRVKSIKLSDEWNSMLSENGGTNLENMEYGQTYSYDVEGKSSGVATYEPNASSENPLIQPFFPKNGNYAEKIGSPRENNYVEKPFGEGFFPAPKVTYSCVTVKNLDRIKTDKQVKKHATGKVVTKFFTSYDFPTIVEWTDLKDENVKNDIAKQNLGSLLASLSPIMRVRSHLALSQGFSIETNDMNGKMKSQEVYAEGADDEPISKVEYKYNVADDEKSLDSEFLVINSKGEVSKKIIGLDYDVINDFNESNSNSTVAGLDGNLAVFLAAIFPVFVGTVIPKYSYHENVLRTAVTTKHVHKTGVLIEKIATDLGSTVSTKNLAWDSESGQVLLTETVNEYGDHYFSFSYPAYWMYEGMGLASNNIGIEGVLEAFTPSSGPTTNPSAATTPYFRVHNLSPTSSTDLSKYFKIGDELFISDAISNAQPQLTNNLINKKLWVYGYNNDKTGILLIDKNGNYINKCLDFDKLNFKIVRSGNRNLQSASMASITLMKNPIKITDRLLQTGYLDQDILIFDGSQSNPRIVNASAVVYNDFWRPQNESRLPFYPNNTSVTVMDPNGLAIYPNQSRVNPFLWNIKGDWRAEKSYAYLTGRNASAGQVNNPRNEGFYNKFNPFYKLDENKKWYYDIKTDWTYASSVSKYSPYGVELENKDALNRHSAAQYGYNYTLPMAVASNSKYEQIGFEGFEESDISDKHFGFDIDRNAISGNQSHTGKKSIKVLHGEKVKLTNSLREPVIETITSPCPSIPSTTSCTSQLSDLNYATCISNNTGSFYHTKRLRLTFEPGLIITGHNINPIHIPGTSYPLEVNLFNVQVSNNTLTFCVDGKFTTDVQQNEPSSLGEKLIVSVNFSNGTSCCVMLEVGGHVTLNFLKYNCSNN